MVHVLTKSKGYASTLPVACSYPAGTLTSANGFKQKVPESCAIENSCVIGPVGQISWPGAGVC